jgi:hypothetical protein
MKRWTPNLAVSRSRRNIAAAIERLRVVSCEWADVDRSIEDEAEDFIRELDEFAMRITKDIADRLAAGEHVGL